MSDLKLLLEVYQRLSLAHTNTLGKIADELVVKASELIDLDETVNKLLTTSVEEYHVDTNAEQWICKHPETKETK